MVLLESVCRLAAEGGTALLSDENSSSSSESSVSTVMYGTNLSRRFNEFSELEPGPRLATGK